jgi:TonB family protein
LLVPARALSHDIVPPKPTHEPRATYPEGEAEPDALVAPVEIIVDAGGAVTDARMEATLGAPFDTAALDAARRYRFTPATKNGAPVAARVRTLVRFAPRVTASAAASVGPKPANPAGEDPRTSDGADVRQDTDEVRVAGSTPPRSASEVVRERDVLAAAPHRTASDLLLTMPGMVLTQHSGEGKAHQIFLRGFDAVHGQDIELWVGGAPVNEVSNVHGQGYADLHFAMPEVVQKVRGQPGPFDPRQGDFAIAGSVRMDLGLEEPGVFAKATYGSFDTRRLFFAYRPESSDEQTFAAAEVYETDGFGPSRAARRTSAVAQSRFPLGRGVSLRVLATAYAARFDAPGVVRRRDVEEGRFPRFGTYDPAQGGSSTRGQLVVALERSGAGGQLSLTPFVVVRSLTLRQNFTGYVVDPVRGDRTEQGNGSTTFGTTAAYRKGVSWLSSRDLLEVGLYARHDMIEQSQVREAALDRRVTATLVDADVRATNVAAYADAAVFPWKVVALRGGVRADALAFSVREPASAPSNGRVAQGALVQKRGTLDVAASRGVHLLASYGEGFRSPQARSLSDGERTPFTTVRAVEAGVRYAEGRRFSGSLAAFSTWLSDDLAFDNATGRNERVPSTARRGVALELLARPTRALVTSVSTTYTRAAFTATDARFAEGELLPYVPQLVARADMRVKDRVGAISGAPVSAWLGASLTLMHRRPLPFGELGRDIFVTDATVGAEYRAVELAVDVYNALDARYFDAEFVYAANFTPGGAASRLPERYATVGAPRAVLATLTVKL